MPQVNEFSWFISSLKILFILFAILLSLFFSATSLLSSNSGKIKLFYFNSLV